MAALTNVPPEFSAYLDGHYSEYTKYKTLTYLQSSLIKEIMLEMFNVHRIYDLKNIADLNSLHQAVLKLEKNKANHNVYSAALLKYITFLKQ